MVVKIVGVGRHDPTGLHTPRQYARTRYAELVVSGSF